MRQIPPLPDSHSLARIHYLPETIGSVLFGLALMLAGRRLFWLFVGGLGFVTATEFIVPKVAPDNPAVALGIGLVAGLAGAILAIFLQKFAIGLAGAVAGAYYLNALLDAGSLRNPASAWIFILAGAVAGALLLLFLFKWALIVFSSIVGAHLVVRSFLPELGASMAGAAFVLMAIAGIIFQARGLRPRSSE